MDRRLTSLAVTEPFVAVLWGRRTSAIPCDGKTQVWACGGVHGELGAQVQAQAVCWMPSLACKGGGGPVIERHVWQPPGRFEESWI